MSDKKTDPLLKCAHSAKNADRYRINGKTKAQFSHADNQWWNEEYGSTSSSSDSSHIGHRSKAEWENHVTPHGELFYCEFYPQKSNSAQSFCYPFVSSSLQKSDGLLERGNSSGKTAHLIRRRSNRRSFRKKDEGDCKPVKNQMKFAIKRPFNSTRTNVQESDIREVTLHIDPENTCNLGRRATQLENLLGLITVNDGSSVVVSGFISNFSKLYNGKIKIGDYIRSVDGRIVTPDNINSCLSNTTTAREVVLKIQSVEECGGNQVSLNSTLTSIKGRNNKKGDGFAVIYAKLDNISEGGPPGQGVVYSYPNVNTSLSSVCGSCLTLHHLLPEITSAHPISTTVKVKDKLFHILYTHEGKDVLMLSLPNERYSLREAIRVNIDIVRCLRFTYQSLSRCFCTEGNKECLDEFFKKIICRMQNGLTVDNSHYASEFEEILPVSHWLPLPKEAQMHIDDALNELEANDIWAYESQRLYSVIGSSFYHKGYMICSHLNKEDLIDITSLCRQGNLLKLCHDGVKKLIFWKEVFPTSCQRGFVPYSTQPYSTPHGRWFLLIVAQDHDMVVVLLESGGCTTRFDGNPGPDIHYVEEAQATLEHIHKIGIPRFMKKWIETNAKPGEMNSSAAKENGTELVTLIRNSETSRSTQNMSTRRTPELYPLIKHRSNLELQTSAMFESTDATGTLTSNGPVLGRRAERERAFETSSQSRISESEVSDDSDWLKDRKSCDGSSVFDMSDFGKNLFSDNNIIPSRITAGADNVLFHYVHLDNSEGVLLSGISSGSEFVKLSDILHNFRLHAHHIHNILMNTVSFKRLKVQEISSNVVNKSLAAIKEHGLLFVYNNVDNDRIESVTYWIIGRLFFVPHPREVYVCYQDTCPQNMVEIAFRLALNASV